METKPDMKLKTHASGKRKTYLLIRCCWKKIWKVDLNMLGGQEFSACSMLKQGTWTGSHLPHPAAMPRSGWWGGGPFCARRTMGRRFAKNQTWESCPRQICNRYSTSMVNCHELALLACHHLSRTMLLNVFACITFRHCPKWKCLWHPLFLEANWGLGISSDA